MADKKNVIVGAARLFIGDHDATAPAPVGGNPGPAAAYATTVVADATDWRDVGYTQDGVELSYEPSFGDVEVDQLLDSARVHKTSMRVTVGTTFAEATLENLLVVWAQGDATLVTGTVPTPAGTATNVNATLTILGGALGESPIERQLIAIGNGPENATTGQYNERIYHVTRAISVESSSHALRRSDATVFPVSFRLLPADSAGAPYGTIRDRVRTW